MRDAVDLTAILRCACSFSAAYRLLLCLRVAGQQCLAAALLVGVATRLWHAEAALHAPRLGMAAVPPQPHRGLGAPDQQRRLRTRLLSVSTHDGLTHKTSQQCQQVLAMCAAQGC